LFQHADALPSKEKKNRPEYNNKKCSSHGFFFFLQREGRVVTLSQRAKASLEIFCLVPELIIIRDFRPLLSAEEKILFDDKNKKQGQN
jgi:hypothetical protein